MVYSMQTDQSHLLTKAREFAIKAHSTQTYGKFPYSKHLDDVVKIVERFTDEIGSEATVNQLKISATLHDIIEDSNITKRDIEREFGHNIADLVQAVTDEPGEIRKERKAKTLPKTRAYGRLAVALKLCDRIANVQNCIDNKNHGLLRMYTKEQAGFKLALYLKEDGLNSMWELLEELITE